MARAGLCLVLVLLHLSDVRCQLGCNDSCTNSTIHNVTANESNSSLPPPPLCTNGTNEADSNGSIANCSLTTNSTVDSSSNVTAFNSSTFNSTSSMNSSNVSFGSNDTNSSMDPLNLSIVIVEPNITDATRNGSVPSNLSNTTTGNSTVNLGNQSVGNSSSDNSNNTGNASWINATQNTSAPLANVPSCMATINGDLRDCCPATGRCAQSSCTVFGFDNLAKVNCRSAGAHPNCPESYCDWAVDGCLAADSTHCYGTVACKDGSNSCFGHGQLCLENGHSANYKICSPACEEDDDCPSGSKCDTAVRPAMCTAVPLTAAESQTLIAQVYGNLSLNLSFGLGLNASDLAALAGRINFTDVIEAEDAIYSFVNLDETKDIATLVSQEVTGGLSILSLLVEAWGHLASKAVMVSHRPDAAGFAAKGLHRNRVTKHLCLFSLNQLSAAGAVIGNALTFRIKLSRGVRGLVAFSYSDDDTEGTDITTQGGSITLVGDDVAEISVMTGLAFSLGVLTPPAIGAEMGEVRDYLKLKYKQRRMDASAVVSMTASALALMASTIVESEVITGANSVFSYLVTQASQMVQFQPSGTTVSASNLTVESWGATNVSKAVIISYAATVEGFALMNLTYNAARLYAFMVSIDRLSAAGALMNDQAIDMSVLIPDAVAIGTTLIIRAYNASFPAGVDVTEEGGAVHYMGKANGHHKWHFKCGHTSVLTGEVTPATAPPAEGSDHALYGLLALLALIPLCAMAAWWFWCHRVTQPQDEPFDYPRYPEYMYPTYQAPLGTTSPVPPVAPECFAYPVPGLPSTPLGDVCIDMGLPDDCHAL